MPKLYYFLRRQCIGIGHLDRFRISSPLASARSSGNTFSSGHTPRNLDGMQLPTLIALFLSATAVFGAVFQSDLKLHKSAQARRANKSDPKGVHRGERLKSGSQPVTDFLIGNDLLLVDVSLGTPGKYARLKEPRSYFC